jgi:hypothetical protein
MDLFEGIIIDTKLGPGGLRFVDLDQVAAIDDRVVLRLPAAEVKRLAVPPANPAVTAYHPTDEAANNALRRLARAWNLFCGRPMGDGGRGAGRTTRRLVAGPESGTGGHRDQ